MMAAVRYVASGAGLIKSQAAWFLFKEMERTERDVCVCVCVAYFKGIAAI
jgi:hypothetical protein